MDTHQPEPRVISASRRTDIPAHYTPWLLRRLREGRCRYFHVFDRQWHEVDLRPEAVRAIVFWSKNLGPLLPHLDGIAGDYPFTCHLTITGHPPLLEPTAQPPEETVRQAREVARRYSPHHVLWRFDPIVITDATPLHGVVERFTRLADALAGATRICSYSFVQEYRKVNARLSALGMAFEEIPLDTQHELVLELAEIAQQREIELRACCVPAPPGGRIPQARCIDPKVLAAVGMKPGPDLKRAATRQGCGCYRSVDIGAYDTCPSGCVFCYATRGLDRAQRYRQIHDPAADSLG
ncbi:MAG: DUF1848 domain-containing protein [Armatimonadetes bacterium]|nr:DUF1848 domain-containing protein [Armatimonadota bacterium]